jgi:hypothetical protein
MVTLPMSTAVRITLSLTFALAVVAPARAAPLQQEHCDVIVMGGTTAGLAAAVAAAREIDMSGWFGRVVCLIEPTNWPGGQLTASGVPAIDFAHHRSRSGVDTSSHSRRERNNARMFNEWMQTIAPALGGLYGPENNPGKCWVSHRCYEPRSMVQTILDTLEALRNAGLLKVFWNTVPQSVTSAARRVGSIRAVQRLPPEAAGDPGALWYIDPDWNYRLSEVLADWYSEAPSARFPHKRVLELTAPPGRLPIVIDASEWGELLVLSGARFQQGIPSDEQCGQAMAFPLALQMQGGPVALAPLYLDRIAPLLEERSWRFYALRGSETDTQAVPWHRIWSYRRVRGAERGQPSPGDVSVQNWGMGNDYPFGYLLQPAGEARRSATSGQWRGGVHLDVLAAAEVHALGWYEYLREADPFWGPRIALSNALGTASGLSRIPYMRDTRRAIGRNFDGSDYTLSYTDLSSGAYYADRIGIGTYAGDIHPVRVRRDGQRCQGWPRWDPHPELFYLPLRAHTSSDFDNLLVAGKTMAQDFASNAATRVHPIELSSGTGVGVAAAYMMQYQLGTGTVLASTEAIGAIQSRIRRPLPDGLPAHAPLDWSRP